MDFSFEQLWPDLIRITVAFVLALPIGWHRSHQQRNVGLRTFPIVSIASCGFILIIQSLTDVSADAQARILQGLMAGIGFIGGGVILKTKGQIYGLATAASIWNTTAVGAAVAFQRIEIAVILSLANFLTLLLLTPLVKEDVATEPEDSE